MENLITQVGKPQKASCYLQPSSLNFISLYVSTPADQESARSDFLTNCYTELHCKTYKKLVFPAILPYTLTHNLAIQGFTMSFLLVCSQTPIYQSNPH